MSTVTLELNAAQIKTLQKAIAPAKPAQPAPKQEGGKKKVSRKTGAKKTKKTGAKKGKKTTRKTVKK
jgi:hypothetical protein